MESDHETLERVWTVLEEQGWSGDYELIFSGKTLLEMTVRGANKGGIDVYKRQVGQMAMQWPQLKHGPKISACPSLTAMV